MTHPTTPHPTTKLSSVTCPISGITHGLHIPHLAGNLHLTAIHPLVTCNLPPSAAIRLGTEWLLWRSLYRLQQVGGIKLHTPVPASYFGGKIHKAVELLQAMQELTKWREHYPRYAHAEHSTPASLLAWLETVWRLYTQSGELSFQTAQERTALRLLTSSKLDEALRVQASRKAKSSLKEVLTAVTDYMEDLPQTGWTTRHTEWMQDTATKAVPALSILQLLRERLIRDFPDAHFVGIEAAQQCEQAIQHIETCMLQQAKTLAEFSFSEQDEIEAAQVTGSIQAKYTGLNLSSKIGYVVVPATSKTGQSTSNAMAHAIAEKLKATLQASTTEPAPQPAPQLPSNKPLTPMQRAIAARNAAQAGAAK